jgi:hypothetical protein
MEGRDRERLRSTFALGLKAEAARRFGTERAEALGSTIEETAGQLADVALFPLEDEEGPAFYMDRSGQ